MRKSLTHPFLLFIAAGVIASRGDGRLNAGITNDAMFYVWHLNIDAAGGKFFRMDVAEAP